MNLALDRKRLVRMIAVTMLLLSALVLTSCPAQGGTYQGGGDSVPHYRK